MSSTALVVLLLASWLLPAAGLLVAFALMRDEPGGPDGWMALLWPGVLALILIGALRERLRRGRSS